MRHPTRPVVGTRLGEGLAAAAAVAIVASGASARRAAPPASAAGFRIASVTKTFTAAAILRLVESGRLGLDREARRARDLAPARKRRGAA